MSDIWYQYQISERKLASCMMYIWRMFISALMQTILVTYLVVKYFAVFKKEMWVK